jgi:membrane associated rhomboid family serine protease
MFFLLFLGSRVEYSFGSVRFMVYFFITGIAAGIFSNLLSPGDDAIKIGV